MNINIDVLLCIFLIVSAYYIFMSIVATKPINESNPKADFDSFGYVILVPAHNEELVIADTMQQLWTLPGRYHVVVIDDGSTDMTADKIQPYLSGNIHLFRRIPPNAGKGKGPALNAAYRYVTQHIDEWFPNLTREQIAIGVTDADVFFNSTIMYEVVDMFQRPNGYGAVQVPVAIRGSATNIWLLMQDMEFMSYFYVIQRARHWISSVAMGGNGQFIRYSAMKTLGEQPWSDALTEDIDIGMCLLANNHTIAFTGKTPVVQHGLTSLRRLIKQRTRWVQGHYQVWRRLPVIWRSKRATLVTKTDTTLYLFMILMPWVLLLDYLIGFASMFGYLHASSYILSSTAVVARWFPAVVQLVLSFSIQLVLLPTYFKVTGIRAPWYTWLAIAVCFALYAAFVWITASIIAMYRIITRKKNWTKTEREVLSVNIEASM